jgi:hypothetical protein
MNHLRNMKFRQAVNDYLNDIRSEATLEKRIERIKKLKQEVGEIFSCEFIHANFEKIKNRIIHNQNYSAGFSDKISRDYLVSQKNKNIESFRFHG